MHLLAPLAAGMAGAAGGTVEVYARGTTTPITLWTDFEGTITTANPATLDANGRAKLYVDQYARCVVKNSSGVNVIDFVDGKDANAVEVRSASFVGNAYVGGAAAAGNPLSVEAVLNKAITSFGGTDWNVLLAGSSVPLQTALGALWRARVFDVKAYGALGDDATNDLNAINAAISAANAAGGGVVYFPPGTYRISATLTTFATVCLVGAGRTLSTIKPTVDTPVVSSALPRVISDLAFSFSSASYTCWIYYPAAESGRVVVERCNMATATAAAGGWAPIIVAASASGDLTVRDCYIAASSSATACVSVNGTGTVRLVDNTLRLESSSATAAVVLISTNSSVVAVGNVVWIYQAGIGFNNQGNGSSLAATGNKFVLSTAGNYTSAFFAFGTGISRSESGNEVSAFLSSWTASWGSLGAAAGRLYEGGGSETFTTDVRGSREGASHICPSPNDATVYLGLAQTKVKQVRTTAGAGTRNLSSAESATQNTKPADGATAVLYVHNDTGSSITYQWAGGFASSGSTFAVAANSARAFSLVYSTERVKWFLVSDLAGAETAE